VRHFMAIDSRWQDLYQDAVIEIDPFALRNKIRLAQAAISARSQELLHADGLESVEERRLMMDALNSLRVLETYELKTNPKPSAGRPSA
jgi:hypothetical protein